jgi:hypothetical protein
LTIKKGKLLYYVGQSLVGQVPLANLKKIEILSEKGNPNALGRLFGGGGGAVAGASEIEITFQFGLKLSLRKASDTETFWPDSMYQDKKEIWLQDEWNMSYVEIVKRIRPEIAKHFYDHRMNRRRVDAPRSIH